MKLSEALSRISGGSTEKTAATLSVVPAATSPSSDAGEKLKLALKEATAPATVTKTAANTGSPVADLTKIATDLSQAEHSALVKEAQLYGAAVCDGFMARAAQYTEAANATPSVTKTAAVNDGSFEKFASENPELVKEAAELGYNTTMGQLEKLAEDAYAKGWNDTVSYIYKAASDTFVAGFKACADLLEQSR